MKDLKELIGFELVSLDNKKMTVAKDGRTYTFEFITDGGELECNGCSWAEISTKLYIDDNIKPVITNIKEEHEFAYSAYHEVKITLFGIMKPLAEINASTGNSYDWYYGETVEVVCKELDYSEILSADIQARDFGGQTHIDDAFKAKFWRLYNSKKE